MLSTQEEKVEILNFRNSITKEEIKEYEQTQLENYLYRGHNDNSNNKTNRTTSD